MSSLFTDRHDSLPMFSAHPHREPEHPLHFSLLGGEENHGLFVCYALSSVAYSQSPNLSGGRRSRIPLRQPGFLSVNFTFFTFFQQHIFFFRGTSVQGPRVMWFCDCSILGSGSPDIAVDRDVESISYESWPLS